jgi:hypothetical protein
MRTRFQNRFGKIVGTNRFSTTHNTPTEPYTHGTMASFCAHVEAFLIGAIFSVIVLLASSIATQAKSVSVELTLASFGLNGFLLLILFYLRTSVHTPSKQEAMLENLARLVLANGYMQNETSEVQRTCVNQERVIQNLGSRVTQLREDMMDQLEDQTYLMKNEYAELRILIARAEETVVEESNEIRQMVEDLHAQIVEEPPEYQPEIVTCS